MTWYITYIGFEDPLRHFIAFTFIWTKDADEYIVLRCESSCVIPIVTPSIPCELTEVGNVTIFTSDGEVCVSLLKLEQVLGKKVVYAGATFTEIIPKQKRTIGFLHVLAKGFLE